MSDPAISFVTNLPFPKRIGVTEGEGGALALPEDPTLGNHIGTLHAGALFTLGESASGVAVLRAVAPALGGAIPVAKTATIAYKRPAKGKIRATGTVKDDVAAIAARIEADGKTTFDVEVKLEDEAGVVVAEMTVAWYVRKAV